MIAKAINHIRRTEKYTWMNYNRYEDILKELKTEPILNIFKYESKWIQYVYRMQRNSLN
jgi:histone acetyltransferase (RNA polymerase elongator complex component)